MEWIVNTTRKISLALAVFASAACAQAKVPVLLSTDVGNEIDDQWAIAYLLTSPEFDVLGILSAHAPTLPAPSAHVTYKILVEEVEHRLNMAVHPPLLEGASLPLADLKTPQPSAAAEYIVRASKPFSSDNRLNVLAIGAATDVASAILIDPGVVDRINVIAMGFKNLSAEGGKEYNVENDPKAWQVILHSSVPVTIGSADVCRAHLALSFQGAAAMLSGHGPVADWLWSEYQTWYFAHVKPLRVNDFSKPWIIWDIITLAYLREIAATKPISRPSLSSEGAFTESGSGEAKWIISVDSNRLWKEFVDNLDSYTSTHALARADKFAE